MGGGSDRPSKLSSSPQVGGTPRMATSSPKRQNEYTVLVTGFGPYPDGLGGRHLLNASHLITQHIPDTLPVSHPLNPTSLPIRILNPTSGSDNYVRTEYGYVRTFIQSIYDEYQDSVDAFVHLGMADGWEFYGVEERAFNERFTCNWGSSQEAEEGYFLIPDDKGRTVRDLKKDEGKGMWEDAPTGLGSTVDVKKVVSDVRAVVNNLHPSRTEECKAAETGPTEKTLEKRTYVEVLSHLEPGSYLCGFIYYESLATCRKRKLDTKVVFCHVPGWKEVERLERGADVISAVIGAVCKQVEGN